MGLAVRLFSYDLSVLPVLLVAMASIADTFACLLQVVQFACCLTSARLNIALMVSLATCVFSQMHM